MGKDKAHEQDFIDMKDLQKNAHQTQAGKILLQDLNKIQSKVNHWGTNGGPAQNEAMRQVYADFYEVQKKYGENNQKEKQEHFGNILKEQQDLDKKRDGEMNTRGPKKLLEYQKKADSVEAMGGDELDSFVYAREKVWDIDYDTAVLVKRELNRRGKKKELQKWSELMDKHNARFDWLHTTDEGRAAKKYQKILDNSNQNTFTYNYEGATIGIGLKLENLIDLSGIKKLPK